MSEESHVLADHVDHSVGGFGGHAFRRFTHVSMTAIPFVYYLYGQDVADIVSLEAQQLVSVVCILILFAEAIRIRLGIVIFGQREYEADQISALAWGGLAVSLALLLAPGEGEGLEAGIYGIPLIVGLTLVDPLMGEIKRIKKDLKLAIYFGLLMSYAVWLTCYFWLGTDIRAAILLAPLTVLGELPKTKDIDDNATMILFPLAGLMLLLPFL
ncbi:MAG: hypothetical protein CMA47_00260 [Euryarchaeota archaeon]|uniref:Putative membrane protein n=1 Tax=uncultured marine group II/III euryarchaeote AD1000_03_F11 TaxID=1457703 RepID=A0A075FHF4_9EURY|nr:putative membrane protein [uncultured marine group II/III euryarchaeote AD1000_03_F11]MAQ56637.1 hypothetical protein [Euryarchaeota archaeon]